MAIYNTISSELSAQILSDREKGIRSPYAFKDENVIRRYLGSAPTNVLRPASVMDVEKVIHNPYYNRYADKTQVLSFYQNDDVSRRALHVQLVSRTARTIGMNLGLNLDLIEAISLGHDIGHTPFGHAGERLLSKLYSEHTGRLFNHNVHSARVLDKLIQRNISLQVLSGVLSHNGEMEQQEYKPRILTSFNDFDKDIESCYTDPDANARQCPNTLEGCVMRISDIIAYLGKDRQDALKIGLIEDDKTFTSGNLGSTNSEIINNITVSIIENSYGKPYISMDKDTFDMLKLAKSENYNYIYKNPEINDIFTNSIEPMFSMLYEELLKQAENCHNYAEGFENTILFKHHIQYIKENNRYVHYFSSLDKFMEDYINFDPNELVVDYIASMTDDYFIELFKYLFPDSKLSVSYKGYFN